MVWNHTPHGWRGWERTAGVSGATQVGGWVRCSGSRGGEINKDDSFLSRSLLHWPLQVLCWQGWTLPPTDTQNTTSLGAAFSSTSNSLCKGSPMKILENISLDAAHQLHPLSAASGDLQMVWSCVAEKSADSSLLFFYWWNVVRLWSDWPVAASTLIR